MKRTVVDRASGDVVCPSCGARNNFVSKRTGKAKLIGVATVGVGVVAMPKRLKCNGCGTNLKRGRVAAAAPSDLAKAIALAVIVVIIVVALASHH